MTERKLAVFDIDGVLYSGHTIFDIIRAQEKEGFIPEGTWKQVETALVNYKNGSLLYEAAANKMLESYVSSLKDKTYEEVKAYVKSFLNENKSSLYPYVREILPILQKTHDVFLLTTNLQVTAETFVEMYGLQGFLSSTAEVKNGKFTGVVERSLAGHKAVISELLEKYPFKGSIAIGDSANDISMLEKVEYPIAIDPDEKLLIQAQKKHWEICTPESVEKVFIKVLELINA